MDTPVLPPHDADELDRLRAEVDAGTRLIRTLQDELEETNRGVVVLYAELDVQAAQLRAATELKSRFLAYMSHEFRTPVAAIRSLAALLLDRVDGPLTAGQETAVRFIHASAGEFAEMINDLLDLAKVEAGRVEIAAEWFETVDLFSALRGLFRPILTDPAVALVFDEPPRPVRMYGDNRRLSQILRNFISNALKFTDRGEVRVSAQLNGDETVTFRVADNGIGIAPEHQRVLFEDFTQIDSPIQKRLLGTGLGLSLSRRLAELLGGSVGVRSTPGQGSTFHVTLPIHWTAPPKAAAEVPS